MKASIASLLRYTTAAGWSLSLVSALDVGGLLDSLAPAPPTDPRFTNWKAPGPGDVRSPCPGLNTLANHGFIPHDGRNNTIPVLLKGLAAGMNMGADFTLLIGGAGLLSSSSPLAGSFDLDDLDQHNFPIEHDASLSREDAYFGDDHSFQPQIWQTALDYYGVGGGGDDDDGDGEAQTSLPVAAEIRSARYNDSRARNPDFTFGLREFVLAFGETALYLQTMGSPEANGVAPVEYVRTLFEEERLPFDEGWRPSPTPITLASLGEMVLQLFAETPGNFAQGAGIVADSYKDLFEALIGGSEVLANLTQGLSEAVGL